MVKTKTAIFPCGNSRFCFFCSYYTSKKEPMRKNTHFTGQPIYAQLLSLIYKSTIKCLSIDGCFDRYVKRLDGYAHLVVMLYGVLMRHESLREIVIGMLSEANKL